MTGEKRRHSARVAVILAAAVLLRLLFVFGTPLGTGAGGLIPGFNDEESHLNYVRYLAEKMHFPVQTMSIDHPEAFTRNEFEYYQPPLFYLLSAPVHRAAATLGMPVHIPVRILCVVFGVLAIYVTYLTLNRIFLGHRERVLTGILFLAVVGVHVRFSSLVSNDSLLWLVAAVYIHLLVRAGEQPGNAVNAVLLALVAGCGLLTKSSFVLLLPAVFVPYTDTSSLRVMVASVRRPAVILLGCAVLSGAWYVRNLLVYDELLAMSVGSGMVRGLGFPLIKSMAFIVYQNAFSLWFPFVTWPYSIPVKVAVVILGAISLVMAGGAAYTAYRVWHYRPGRRRLLVLAAVMLVPLLAGSLRFSMQYGQVNFRHLLPLGGVWAVAFATVLHRMAGCPAMARALLLGCCGTAYAAAFLLL